MDEIDADWPLLAALKAAHLAPELEGRDFEEDWEALRPSSFAPWFIALLMPTTN
jgi:hypothetical protein